MYGSLPIIIKLRTWLRRSSLGLYKYTYTHTYIYIYTYLYIYICIYVNMYICIYILAATLLL